MSSAAISLKIPVFWSLVWHLALGLGWWGAAQMAAPTWPSRPNVPISIPVSIIERQADPTTPSVPVRTKVDRPTAKKSETANQNIKAMSQLKVQSKIVSPVPPAKVNRTSLAQQIHSKDASQEGWLLPGGMVPPKYPRFSWLRKEQGVAWFLVQLQNGKIASLQLERSSGFSRLDRAAQQALEKWKFKPHLELTYRQKVQFQISR